MSRTKPSPAPTPPKTFNLNPPSRQLLSRKLATSLLPPLSTHPYTTINLSGCALGDAAAAEAGPHLLALAKKQCLETVILSDVIASLPPDVALRTLSTLALSIGTWKRLKSVDLANNALGSRGLAQCAPLIDKQTRLESLFLAETGLAAQSARLLHDYFPAATTSLRVLDIHGNRLESQGLTHIAAIVQKSPNLKRLRVSSVGASAEATTTLARALASTNGITELDISDNALDKEGAIALSNVLIRQRSLSRLALADLCMRDEALIALLVPLTAAQCPIAELLLAGNELTSASIVAIGRYLNAHSTELRALDLCGNDLADNGVTQLAEAVRDAGAECALANVLIADNEVSSLPIVALAQELVKLPGMRRFDVRGNYINAKVGEALSGAFGPGVVVWDPAEDGNLAREPSGEELDNALQGLADMADVVERPALSPSASTESPSALSRLGNWFGRGPVSEEDSSARPSSQVDGVEGVSAMDDSGIIGGAVEDDSGEKEDEEKEDEEKQEEEKRGEDGISEWRTPEVQRRDAGGVTALSSSTADAIERMEEDVIRQVGGDNNVMQSAKKLKNSIAELSKEIIDVKGELDEEGGDGRVVYSRAIGTGDMEADINRYLLVSSDGERSSKKLVGEIVADIFGGLLVAVFVVVLVLAIVQSQEENTFSYAPV